MKNKVIGYNVRGGKTLAWESWRRAAPGSGTRVPAIGEARVTKTKRNEERVACYLYTSHHKREKKVRANSSRCWEGWGFETTGLLTIISGNGVEESLRVGTT